MWWSPDTDCSACCGGCCAWSCATCRQHTPAHACNSGASAAITADVLGNNSEVAPRHPTAVRDQQPCVRQAAPHQQLCAPLPFSQPTCCSFADSAARRASTSPSSSAHRAGQLPAAAAPSPPLAAGPCCCRCCCVRGHGRRWDAGRSAAAAAEGLPCPCCLGECCGELPTSGLWVTSDQAHGLSWPSSAALSAAAGWLLLLAPVRRCRG